ncbi:class I SAM-dependent methyltransferase [Porticoccus sp. W117]|uniref:class I SAM-dependent methyltransferase n=1 Tax=Porticoccus sp. W117 TaxID=3054777 RepID=UPI002594E813|nr:class I SAM-dependent methyltransferase [Porticoccus sp. W117]MDM3872226.1 class I SAM-dependent methyltransferase [Porticoccus sp. W117]
MKIPCALSAAPGFEVRGQALAAELGLELVRWPVHKPPQNSPVESTAAFLCLLIVDEHGLGLQLTGPDAPGTVRCDFVSGAAAHRRQYGGGRKQDISRAIGLDKRRDLQVLDMTAGLGRDAFVLATLGAQMTLLERNPIVHALLADGLQRASEAADSEVRDIAARMELLQQDALVTDMSTLAAQADVVYLDPMFPGRQKSAKVKKEMQAFHVLVGDDPDADQLLPMAMEVARYRVVVKRPAKAPYLNDCQPSVSLTGKSTRYDIYSKQKLG